MEKEIRIVRDIKLDPIIGDSGEEKYHAYNVQFGITVNKSLIFFVSKKDGVKALIRPNSVSNAKDIGDFVGTTNLEEDVICSKLVRTINGAYSISETPEPYLNVFFEDICGVKPMFSAGSIGQKIISPVIPSQKREPPKLCVIS